MASCYDDAAPSQKNDTEESVEDMLANVDQFIDSVYRDLSISPPRRSSSASNALRPRRSLDDASSGSSSAHSPTVLLSGATIFNATSTPMDSPGARRNMDAQIERIDRICDNVDQNLRSIGLFINNSSLNNISEHLSSTDLTSSPSSIISTVISNRNPNENDHRRRPFPIVCVGEEVVDLSNSQTQTTEILEQPIRVNNHCDNEDDDVILVSDNLPPLVDLCTPRGHLETPQERRTIQLRRRRLHGYDNVDETDSCCGNRLQPRKRRTGPSDTENTSSTLNAADRPLCMCPVCMESCLQRQPTSTLCGHIYCKGCIEHAINLTHKCPMCNMRLNKKQIFRIYL